MEKIEAKIHHLFHSGFAVETSSHFLIFDYFLNKVAKGYENTIENGVITPELIREKKNVLVFVTHNHKDHFNPVIFQWQQYNPLNTYILSDDVTVPSHLKNVYTMESYNTLTLEDTTSIKTYGTTDQGVSFLVKVDGFTIFHAGDLNWWHWKNSESEKQLIEEKDFKREVNQITETIDIAFVPVDPRLEEYFHLGGEYFAHKLNPKLLIPMHFANEYHITQDFSTKVQCYPISTFIINQRGETISFNKLR